MGGFCFATLGGLQKHKADQVTAVMKNDDSLIEKERVTDINRDRK